MKSKLFLQITAVVLSCIALFSAVIFYFSKQNLLGVDVPKSDVPYIDGRFIPNDSTVLFIFEDGSGAAVQLLFEKRITNVLLLKTADEKTAEAFGYSVNHTASCDYSFLIKFINLLGGIEAPDNSGYTLTGVQVCNMLSQKENTADTQRAIVRGVLNKISKNGFSTDLLYCIIENTNTTLSAPACYGWVENLKYSTVAYNVIDGR